MMKNLLKGIMAEKENMLSNGEDLNLLTVGSLTSQSSSKTPSPSSSRSESPLIRETDESTKTEEVEKKKPFVRPSLLSMRRNSTSALKMLKQLPKLFPIFGVPIEKTRTDYLTNFIFESFDIISNEKNIKIEGIFRTSPDLVVYNDTYHKLNNGYNIYDLYNNNNNNNNNNGNNKNGNNNNENGNNNNNNNGNSNSSNNGTYLIDINVICELLKNYFREMEPDTLLAKFLINLLKNNDSKTIMSEIEADLSNKEENSDALIKKIKNELSESLKEEYLRILFTKLFTVLNNITKNTESNKMNYENLSVCWSPNLYDKDLASLVMSNKEKYNLCLKLTQFFIKNISKINLFSDSKILNDDYNHDPKTCFKNVVDFYKIQSSNENSNKDIKTV